MTRRVPGTDPLERLHELTRHLAHEIERQRAPLAVFSVPVPVVPPESLLRIDPAAPAALWEPPEGPALAGLGEAWRLDLQGPGRFAELERVTSELWRDSVHVPHPDAPQVAPSVLGGLAFEAGRATEWKGFGDGCFVLPRWTYVVEDGRAGLQLALAGSDDFMHVSGHLQRFERLWRALARPPDSLAPTAARPRVLRQMPPDEWSGLVEAARSAITAGVFEKVVLARQTLLTLDGPVDPAAVLARLRELQPDTFRFAFRRGTATFLGATPEPLLVQRGARVEAQALAGTAPRELPSAAAALVASAKDRVEHAIVVDAIRAGLAPFCRRLDVPGAPEIRELREVFHLSTPIRGELAEPAPLPRLLSVLHPTPAIGGHPRDAALAWIAEHEPGERGWYAGPVGRIGSDGDGEFAVAIRSALVEGSAARLFAGAGIVAGSDPAAEFEETTAKERTILAALGEQ